MPTNQLVNEVNEVNEVSSNESISKVSSNQSINEVSSNQSSSNQSYSRKLCLSDLLDNNDKNEKNYSHRDSNTIQKNQQEFGHKKRIKP